MTTRIGRGPQPLAQPQPLQRTTGGPAPRPLPPPAQQPPGWARAGFGQDGMLAVKTSGPAAGATAAAPKMPKPIADLLKAGRGVAETKGEFAAITASIGKGDYAAAAKGLEEVLRKKEEFIDEELGTDGVRGARSALEQLEFLSKMQAAGVKADYPPTQAQLEQYFGTLKSDPGAAREALGEYFQAFHKHPGLGKDVAYGPKEVTTRRGTEVTTQVPTDWEQIAGQPAPDQGQWLGKQHNDCEGFAFMAEKLLKAAGFEVKDHLTVGNSPVGEHAMVAFTHKGEKGVTVTSNDGVFQARSEKDAAKQGYAHALGEGGKPTGKETYSTGATMKDSQVNAMSGGPRL